MKKTAPGKAAMILNEDRYFYPDALDEFLRKTKHKIAKIYVLPSFIDPLKKKQYEKASLKIMGPAFAAKYVLRVATRTLSPFYRLSSIAKVARQNGIPCQAFRSVNGEDFLADLRRENIHIGLSMVSQIYKEPILAIPGLRLFNFHPSLLPRNKGKFPLFWAFLNQEKEQGITCHQITPRIDDGEIVFQRYFDLAPEDDVPSLLEKFVRKMPAYMEEALDRIHSGEFQRLDGDFRPFYGPVPSDADIRKYRELLKDRC